MFHNRRALDTEVQPGNSRAWQTDRQIDLGTAGRGPRPASDWTERLASAWPESPVTLRHGKKKEIWGRRVGTVMGKKREIRSQAGGQGEQQCSGGKKKRFCGLWLRTVRPSVWVNKSRVHHTCGLVLELESEEDKQQNISNSGNSCTSSLSSQFYNHSIGFSWTRKINQSDNSYD